MSLIKAGKTNAEDLKKKLKSQLGFKKKEAGEEGFLYLLLDTSSSMSEAVADAPIPKIEVLKHAVCEMTKYIHGSRVSIITFSDTASFLTKPTSDTTCIAKSVSSMYPRGMTALGSALLKAIKNGISHYMSGVRMVIVSDGCANDMPEAEIINIAEEHKALVRIDAIGVGDKSRDNFELLRKLAEITGGVFGVVQRKTDIEEALKLLSPAYRRMLKGNMLMLNSSKEV